MPAVGKDDDETAISTRRSTSQLPRELTPEQRAHFEALAETGLKHEQCMNHQQSTPKKRRKRSLGAQQLAEQSNNPQLEPEHLLVALVEQRDGIVPELLRKMNVDPAALGRERARAAAARCRRRTAARSRACRRA